MRFKIALLTLLFVPQILVAQLTVNNGFTAQDLGNNLAGSNVNVYNASISGDVNQYGLFQYVGNDLGLNSGVILSTGNIFDAVGPNSSGNTSTGYGGPGDPDLTNLAGFNTNDAVVFEFDFEVQGNDIEFNFVFLSEEYNEWVNSGFNDVFAFYISGPGITGQENLAVVPGTTTPVTINSINNGSFWQFYNDNTSGAVNVEFDGFTTLMTASKTGLQQCGVYTLSLRIADGSDTAYDSGVLLQENSLIQSNISATSSTFSANNTALEGCIDASFTFQLDSALGYPVTIPIGIGGTAINGVDYAQIDSLITIPAGQTSATIIIDAIAEGITEGQETVELYYTPFPCQPQDTVFLYIDDYTPLQYEVDPTDITCAGYADGQVDLTVTGGIAPYTMTLTDSLTGNQTVYNTFPVTGLDVGTYYVEIIDGYGCTAEDVIAGNFFDAGQTFIPDGQGQSWSSTINLSGFGATETLQDPNQIQAVCATMEHSRIGELLIELTAPSGEVVILKEQPGGNVTNMGEPCANGPADGGAGPNDTLPGVGYTYCWQAISTYATMVAEAGNYTYSYINQCDLSVQSDKYLPSGSYQPFESFNNFVGATMNGGWTITVTDEIPGNNGYIFDWSISLQADPPDSVFTITEPPAPTFSSTTVLPDCGMSNGAIDLTVTGGAPPFTFLWNTGATTEDLSGIPAGTYTVDVTDDSLCVQTYQVNLSNNGTLTIAGAVTNEICAGQNDGSIDLTVSGATSPTYSWSSGQTTEDISGLAPGTYTVSVVDGVCQGSETFTVTAAGNINIASNITNENCGDHEGIIDITVYGAAMPATYLWSNGATTQDISNLVQGTYYVDITDNNGCAASDTFTVINLVGNCVPNCDLTITASNVQNENCGNTNGSIDLTTFTTNGPIVTSWNNGASTEDIFGLSQGTYIVTLTDMEGCEVIDTFDIVNQTSGLAITSIFTTNEYCGNGQGGANATISGGSQPYSYSWSNGATTEDITGVSAGSYTLTVTDANGCSAYQSINIVNDAGTLAQTYGNAVDEVCGNGNGSIDIIISGGQTPYSYSWSNGATTEDLTGLSAGTYTCTITDAGGCSITTPTYTINNQAGTLSIDDIFVDNEVCGNGDGYIEVQYSGGTAPQTFAWNTGATTQNIYNLSSGTYNLTITDNAGCSVTTGNLSVLNESGTLNLVSVATFDEICGNSTGSVNITISGGSSPISYQWSNGSTSQDLTNVSAGNYSCTVTDANGCQVFVGANVYNNQGVLSVDNIIVTDENCGDGTGALDAIISGAATPVVYSWSNGATTEDISGLSAGTYIIDVTDNNGCTTSASANVDNQSGTLSLDGSQIVNEVCSSGTGSIDITVSGVQTPLTYSWDSGQTTEDISGLSAGTYTCTITDALGCSIIAGPYTVNNSSGGMSLSVTSVTNEACGNSGGAIDITTNGGASPITYNWSSGQSTEDISGLNAGTYILTATDNNGCSTSTSVDVVNDAGTLSVSNIIITDEICGNASGMIDITVSGGLPTYNYSWSNGATTEDINGLTSGNFNVTVTDANGCSVNSGTIVVNNNAGSFSLVGLNVSNEICGDSSGYIDLVVTGQSGSVLYSWSNGAVSQDLNNVPAGTYSGTATDAAGCQLTFSTIVDNDPGNMTVASVVSDATCGNNNGAIDLTINGNQGPITYVWSNGSATEDITGLDADTYICNIVDSAGCSFNYSGVVNAASAPDINGATVTDETCGNADGAIAININGGTQPFTYSWSGPPANPCCTYTLDMQDQGNSWNGAFITVNINGSSVGNFTVPGGGANTGTFNVCTGDNIELVWSSGSFDWECSFDLLDGSGSVVFSHASGTAPAAGTIYTGVASCTPTPLDGPSVSGLTAGNYTVVVTDANGCEDSLTVTVNNTSGALQISNAVVSNETCSDMNGSIDLTASGNGTLTYSWNTGASTEDLSGLAAGTYTVDITDQNGCMLNASYTLVNITNGLTIASSVVTDEVCGDGTGAIDITTSGGAGPLSYNWSNGYTAEDISGLSAGTYTVTINDGTVCDYVETFVVGNNANGINSTATITDESCGNANGSIDMTVTGGSAPLSYLWNNGATTEDISGVAAGTYTCTITDNTGCEYTASFDVITSNNGVAISNANITDEDCGGSDGAIDITVAGGSGSYSFVWSNGATTEDINGLTYGTYNVTVIDANGCTTTGSYNVVSGGFFNYSSAITDETCGNGTGAINMTFSGFGQPQDFLWSNGATTEDISGLNSGWYVLEMSTPFGPGGGCTMVDSFFVDNLQGTITIDSMLVTNETCTYNDGAIDIYVSGGSLPYSFNWSNGATTEDISGIGAGQYTVTVTDANGCVTAGTAEIVNNYYGYGITSAITTDEICGDSTGAVNITIVGGTGPYTYSWSNGATTEDLSGVTSGNYTVTITDAASCSVTNNFVVGNETFGFSASAVVTDETCGSLNGAIDVTVLNGSAPIDFLWSTTDITEDISGLTGGIYTCTITDNTGCSLSLSETVTSYSSNFDIGTPIITDEICGDGSGSIVLNPTGGTGNLDYNWGGTNPCCSYTLNMYDLNNNGWGGNPLPEVLVYINGTLFGNFGVPVGNGNSFSTESIPVCTGDVIDFEYSQGQQNQNNTYEVLDSQGSIIFQDGPNPFNGVAFTTTAVCTAGNSNSIVDLSAGTYTVEITDSVGCVIQDTFVVNNSNGGFYLDTAIVFDDTCGTLVGAIDITIAGGSTPIVYSWNTGASTEDITGLGAGIYDITATDNNGCVVQDTLTVNNFTGGFVIDTAIITDENCGAMDGAIDITMNGGTMPYTYSWNTGATTEDLSGISAGAYNITVTDNSGCTITGNYTVNNNGSPVNMTASNVTIATCATCADGAIDITMDGAGSPYTYSWSTGATTEDISGLNPGTYTVTVTTVDGCTDTFTFTVYNVASIAQNDAMQLSVYPNPSDGMFEIKYVNLDVDKLEIEITDKTGRIVLKRSENVSNEGTIQIDLLKFEAGSYQIKMKTGDRSIIKQLIIF